MAASAAVRVWLVTLLMTDAPELGDVMIRQRTNGRYDVLDAVSQQYLSTFATMTEAVAHCGKRTGAVWRQTMDSRGRPLADPVLVLSRIRV